MKTILFLFTVLVSLLSETDSKPRGPESLPDSGPRYYKMVEEKKPFPELVSHDGEGEYVKLVSMDNVSEDTLRTYVQGVVKGEVKPDYSAAEEADLVIWCYAETYPHSNHVFPQSSGRIFVASVSETKIAVMTESHARKAFSLNSNEDWNRFDLSP